MILTLRLLHIVSGVLWVGMVFLTTIFLIPALYESGPSGGPVMQALVRRRLLTVAPLLGVITLLSGGVLYGFVSGGFNTSYMRSTMGRTLGVGAAFAIAGYILGIAVLRPATMKAGALATSIATANENDRPAMSAELSRLRARAISSGRLVSALLVLAVAMMAIARYL
jgi:hypothetical protein